MTQLSASENLLNTLQRTIDDSDRQRASLHLLDWLGCAIYGSITETGKVFKNYLTLAPKGNITCIDGSKSDITSAAFYNGALGNIMEMDDVHRTSILHPGPIVIPAAIAAAQTTNASIDELLDAIIKGYEATIRLGQSVGLSHYRYYHNTSTCGVLGAAVASAHLLKLDQQQTLSAMGNALSRTGGLWQMRHEDVHTKQWHNAEATRIGVMAAQMASIGLRGPKSIIDGEQGFLAATSTDANILYLSAENPQWLIHDCSFKPWPACRHVHPAMDALQQILQSNKLKASDIKAITVSTYNDAITFCDRPNPSTDVQAKFSIQHALAAWVCLGEPKLEHYQAQYYCSDNGINDELLTLRSKISVVAEQAISANYPEQFAANISVTLSSGEVLKATTVDTLGDPNKPMSIAAIKHKAEYLISKAGIATANTAALLTICDNQSRHALTLNNYLENLSKAE
ncbi:MmgE/PrpD family protein [Thalassomonas sp. M1454]|uniref:MmgE/PrpD family protein n=1 Tax=Thalassomonas sp. M1454 TaxID=2594477 RepID=UPI00117EB6F0|nr:MmgE/PrpD family protein [Thalassomonas sp. M1454]TRX55063.1 MmgE/PrpD family protein [Thalassomonas sp. M1454]